MQATVKAIIERLKVEIPAAYKALVALAAPFLALQLSHLLSLMFHVQIIASPSMVSSVLLSLLVAVPVWWKTNREKVLPSKTPVV